MDYLPMMISSVEEFHRKFDIGINIKSQKEMYARCSLLLEELGELGEVLTSQNYSVREEVADVSYVLIGNLVSLGYYENKTTTTNELAFNSNYESLVLICGLIARKVRKEWAPEDFKFKENILYLHFSALRILDDLSCTMQFDLIKEFMKKHKKNIVREARIIGDTTVVSHWNKPQEYLVG